MDGLRPSLPGPPLFSPPGTAHTPSLRSSEYAETTSLTLTCFSLPLSNELRRLSSDELEYRRERSLLYPSLTLALRPRSRCFPLTRRTVGSSLRLPISSGDSVTCDVAPYGERR